MCLFWGVLVTWHPARLEVLEKMGLSKQVVVFVPLCIPYKIWCLFFIWADTWEISAGTSGQYVYASIHAFFVWSSVKLLGESKVASAQFSSIEQAGRVVTALNWKGEVCHTVSEQEGFLYSMSSQLYTISSSRLDFMMKKLWAQQSLFVILWPSKCRSTLLCLPCCICFENPVAG